MLQLPPTTDVEILFFCPNVIVSVAPAQHCRSIHLLTLICVCLCGKLDGESLVVNALDESTSIALVGGGVVVVVSVVPVVPVASSIAGITSVASVASSIASITGVDSGITSLAGIASIASSIASVSSVASVASVSSVSSVASITSSIAVIGSTSSVAGSPSHLDRNNTAERTCPSRVLAPDETDVGLASDLSSTLLAGRDGCSERMVGSTASIVAASLISLNILGDLDVLPGLCSAVRVDHAGIGTGAIRIDLVQSHLNISARSYLRKVTATLCHDGLSTRLELVWPTAKRLADGRCSRATEASSILLERVAAGSISRSRRHDTQSRSLTASIAHSIGDDAVTRHELGGHQGRDSNDSFERHCDVGSIEMQRGQEWPTETIQT
jgi:hypothetical protein